MSWRPSGNRPPGPASPPPAGARSEPDVNGAARAFGEGLGQALTNLGRTGRKRRRGESSPERSIWLWGLVPIIFACLRLIVVSRGDPETLRALVQNLNVTALVLATILPLGATLIAWILLLAAVMSIADGEHKRGWRVLFGLLLLPTVILVYFAMPLLHIVINAAVLATIVLILICWAVSQHMKAKIAGTVFTAGVAMWLFVVFLAPFILLLARSDMWLPKETLTLGDSTLSPVYVLSTDERWTKYMDASHKVHIVPTTAITNRETVLGSDSTWDKPLAELR